MDLVIVPIHCHGNHWTLALIYPKRCKLVYYDSLSGAPDESETMNTKRIGTLIRFNAIALVMILFMVEELPSIGRVITIAVVPVLCISPPTTFVPYSHQGLLNPANPNFQLNLTQPPAHSQQVLEAVCPSRYCQHRRLPP